MDKVEKRPGVGIPEDLVKSPTVESYRKIMGEEYLNYSRRTIMYLREYEIGLQGVEHLLRLTELFKNELTEQEAKLNRWRLWGFYLELLDKMDRWEDYQATVETMKQNPEGQEFLSQSPPVLTVEGRKAYIASSDRAFFYHSLKARWERRDSSVDAWMISEIGKRVRLIQKKVALQKAGKSVKRYLHKSPSELTDEEYKRRKDVLKFWFEFPKKWAEWAKGVFAERKNRGPGPGDVWVSASFTPKDKISEGGNKGLSKR